MKFSKLIIKNFRSIGSEGLEINFPKDRNLTAIVGANASGKTNVLSALGIVLGMYPFSRFSPEDTDFFSKKSETELLIELYLDPPIVDHDVYRKGYTIAGFRYRAARYKVGERKGTLRDEHYCFDENGNTILKPQRIFRRKSQPDDGVDNTPKPILVSDQAWKLGDLFYLDPPTLERFFDKTTGWSPLGRLFEIYRDDFEADHNVYSHDGKTTMTSKEAFEKFSRNLAGILRTTKLSYIETGLSTRIREYLGNTSDQPLRVEFSLPSHKELFERWVALQISEHSGLPALPIERLGSGYRALLRLAVLETLLDMREGEHTSILLIEEPEMYLHVHLRRYFYQVLRRLAERGHQIIYTTHSPEFIDLAEPHEIVRLHRKPGDSTISKQVAVSTKLDFRRVKQKLRRMGNEEVVFANHAILTEGQDDKGIIEELLVRRGVDPDVHSISIINCDGTGQIKDYIHLCSELGVDFYVVHDRDDDSNKDIKKRNDQIAGAVSEANQSNPSLHVYNPTLEATMGTEKKKGNLDHLLELLGDKSYEDIRTTFPDLIKPIEEFVKSRGLKIEAKFGERDD
jgi:predicted ATP-dependent endonuclease of OLD family